MPTLPCVLDVEASGFGRSSYPIEVGYVRPDGLAACTLIRPIDGWTHWDPQAEAVHGIRRETLLQHGRDVVEVARLLNRGLAEQVVYCDAWGHDYAWLGALFEAAGLVPAFKLEPATKLLDEAALPLLAPERQRALAELGLNRHRASSDAKALQRALSRLLR